MLDLHVSLQNFAKNFELTVDEHLKRASTQHAALYTGNIIGHHLKTYQMKECKKWV